MPELGMDGVHFGPESAIWQEKSDFIHLMIILQLEMEGCGSFDRGRGWGMQQDPQA